MVHKRSVSASPKIPSLKSARKPKICHKNIPGISNAIEEKGKHADLAHFDGEPLETTTHTTGVVIDGQVVSSLILHLTIIDLERRFGWSNSRSLLQLDFDWRSYLSEKEFPKSLGLRFSGRGLDFV